MPTRYRVHLGYRSNGQDRWKYFDTLAAAREFANMVANLTRIILTIVECPAAPQGQAGWEVPRA